MTTAHGVFSYNIILVQHNHTFYEHFSLAACISFTILAKPLVSLLNLAINTAYVETKAEPIMLKNLPIILSQISLNFDPLFLFYSHISPIIPSNFYCINDDNVHNTHGNCYIGQQDVVIVDFSSEFA